MTTEQQEIKKDVVQSESEVAAAEHIKTEREQAELKRQQAKEIEKKLSGEKINIKDLI
jgi:hypothetical protein